jgi:hypothetical protein
MFFANLVHFNEGLSLETLLALKVEKSLSRYTETNIIQNRIIVQYCLKLFIRNKG